MATNLKGFRPVDARSLDWAGLRARLCAARAASHSLHSLALEERRVTPALGCGSFDSATAIRVACYQDRLVAVNPNLSVDGNRGRPKDAAVVRAQVAGDRG